MICYNCNLEMREGGIYKWRDDYIGEMEINVRDGEYYYCDNCGSERLHYKLVKRIEEAEQEMVEKLLKESVGGEFDENLVDRKGVLSILGKYDRRIKTLVFHVKKNGKTYWWKKSIDLFKIYGDGRFKIKDMMK